MKIKNDIISYLHSLLRSLHHYLSTLRYPWRFTLLFNCACQRLCHFAEMINTLELPSLEHLFFQPILEKHPTKALNPFLKQTLHDHSVTKQGNTDEKCLRQERDQFQ